MFGLFFQEICIKCFAINLSKLSKESNQNIKNKKIYHAGDCVLVCAKCFVNDLDFLGQKVNIFLF